MLFNLKKEGNSGTAYIRMNPEDDMARKQVSHKKTFFVQFYYKVLRVVKFIKVKGQLLGAGRSEE